MTLAEHRQIGPCKRGENKTDVKNSNGTYCSTCLYRWKSATSLAEKISFSNGSTWRHPFSSKLGCGRCASTNLLEPQTPETWATHKMKHTSQAASVTVALSTSCDQCDPSACYGAQARRHRGNGSMNGGRQTAWFGLSTKQADLAACRMTCGARAPCPAPFPSCWLRDSSAMQRSNHRRQHRVAPSTRTSAHQRCKLEHAEHAHLRGWNEVQGRKSLRRQQLGAG